MNRTASITQRKTQLRGDVLNILGEEIYYRLYAIRRGTCCCYSVNITSGKESSTCSFGKDKGEAFRIYDKIVSNTVTPCSLRDIADDFNKEK